MSAMEDAMEDANSKLIMRRNGHINLIKDLQVEVNKFISNTDVMTTKEICTLKAYEHIIIEELDKIKKMNKKSYEISKQRIINISRNKRLGISESRCASSFADD